MTYHPKPHANAVRGAVLVLEDAARAPDRLRLPGHWTVIAKCGGPGRCARLALGKIPYIGGWTRGDPLVMLPILEAEQLPDGSWKLGPGYWADTPARRRGPSIPLPAVVHCPQCGGRRLVEAEPVHLTRPQ